MLGDIPYCALGQQLGNSAFCFHCSTFAIVFCTVANINAIDSNLFPTVKNNLQMNLVFHDATFQGDANDIHEKIQYLVDYFCAGNKASFSREAGIPAPVTASITGGRKSKPSFEILQKILSHFPVDANWLVMGQGHMLRDSEVPATIALDSQAHSLTPEQWEMLKKALIEITPARAAAQVETEVLGRTYHFGNERTPGLPYDDRFSMRVGVVGDDLQEFMNTPEQFNQLRHTKIGNRVFVTERAIREWFGDIPKAA